MPIVPNINGMMEIFLIYSAPRYVSIMGKFHFLVPIGIKITIQIISAYNGQ